MEQNLPTQDSIAWAGGNQNLNTNPEKAKRKFHIPKIAILIGFFIVLLALMEGGLYLAKKSDNTTPLIPTPLPNSQASPTKEKTYTTEDVGFTVNLSSDFITRCDSSEFCEFSKWVGPGRGPENLIYVIKEPFRYNDGAEIPETLISLGIGQTNLIEPSPHPQVKDYLYFTRLSDLTVDGIRGKVFENKKNWEFKSGTIHRRIYLENNGNKYQIGGYLQSIDITLEEFNQFLSTFRFTDSAVSSSPPSTPTGSTGIGSSPANPGQTEPAQPIMVACTMEAKLCPDGVTSVGRSGPKCEFEKCPGE